MILLWYSYQMELDVYGAGQTYLANECRGNGRGNSCLFDEFLKWILKRRFTGTTSVGRNLSPDVVATARELSNMRTNWEENWSKLLPSKFSANASPKFSEAYSQVINTIQQARADAGSQNKDISVALDNARTAIQSALQARQHDDADWLIKEVNKAIQDKGFSWVRFHAP